MGDGGVQLHLLDKPAWPPCKLPFSPEKWALAGRADLRHERKSFDHLVRGNE
jgi:hypothetical protein